MKFRKLVIFITVLYCSFSSANTIHKEAYRTVQGHIIDATSKSPLPYVSIVIEDSNRKIVTGAITDDEGHFEIKNLKSGTYYIEITYIGFETKFQKLTLNSKTSSIDLGVLLLSEERALLNEVEIVVEQSTIEQKIDRKVINVGKDLTTLGASAATVLNSVQSVSVDSQSGNVSLRGNENVRVLVDGKPSTIPSSQLLRQLPSNAIKSIELITNPSAKYSPEGMSGIINIVLKKNSRNGFNAAVNSGLTLGKKLRNNNSLNFNYRRGIVNIFGNFGLDDGRLTKDGWIESERYNQNFDQDEGYTNYLIKAGADVYLNDKNTVSFFVNTNANYENRYFISKIEGIDFNSDNPVISITETDASSYNFNYTHLFNREGELLDIEAMYTDGERIESSDFKENLRPYDLTLNYKDDLSSDNNLLLYNIDYVLPISEASTLELGAEARFKKMTDNRITNQYSFVYTDEGDLIAEEIDYDGEFIDWFETNPVGNSSFSYDRDIFSLYTSYSHNFDKVSLQIGGRLEDYRIKANFNAFDQNANFKDRIVTLYPSAFVTYKKSDKHQYQFSYSRRVDRPNMQQVNPIREWSTPLVVSVGNASLLPEFTNSFELNYTYQHAKGNITFGTFYRLVHNPILRSISQDLFFEDKVTFSYLNGDQNHNYGFETSTNYRVSNWWRINASLDLYSELENGIVANELVAVENNVLNARISNNFSASKRLKFQLFGMYRGRNKSIQFDVAPMWMVNLGTSLDILDGKGTVSFAANDIFKGMRYGYDSEIPTTLNGLFNWESQTVNVSFSYRFGSGKNKAKTRKKRAMN